MIPLFSTGQVREADSFAVKELRMPGILLMENASINIYKLILQNLPPSFELKRIGFLCGKGNNGGDGFAAARHFANDGIPVVVIYISDKDMSDDCKVNYQILRRMSVSNKQILLRQYTSVKDLSILKSCNVIVDALLGSGASGELKEPLAEITSAVNRIKKFKVAIDIPTGLDADKGYSSGGFKADLTVTLGDLKKGLFFGDGYQLSGRVFKGSIGLDQKFFERFPVNEYLIEPEDALKSLPVKGKGINKYSSGKVLVIAGSGKYPGAAVLTSRSVLKAGAGASLLAFPESAKQLIHKDLTEVVVEHYNDNGTEDLSEKNIKEIEKRIKWADVVALGPGLGRSEGTISAVLKIIRERKFKKLVIDADGLYPLNKIFSSYNLKDVILTPHLGEFSSLTGVSIDELKKDLLRYGKEFVKQTGSLLVLKGAPTIIFYSDEVFINTTGNPGMAKFGSGDVLTGIISGFASQQKDLLNSVICGVYLHSLTADILKSQMTEYGYTAENIIEKFSASIKFLKDSLAE